MINKIQFNVVLIFFCLSLLIGCKAEVNPPAITDTKDLRIKIAAVDPLQKVFREDTLAVTDFVAEVDVAKGEYATIQFAVRSNFPVKLGVDIENPKFGAAELTNVKSGFVGYVKAHRNFGNPSKYVLFTPSDNYPDPILPEVQTTIPGTQTQPVWISIQIPKDALPGVYKGKIQFTGEINGSSFTKISSCNCEINNNFFSVTKEFTITVHNVTMNKPRLWVDNFWTSDYFSYLNNGMPVEKYSDKYWEYLTDMARIMKEYSQNMVFVPTLQDTKYSKSGGSWQFDFSNFDKTVQIFLNDGGMDRLTGADFGMRSGQAGFTFEDDPIWLFVPVLDGGSYKLKLFPHTSTEVRDFYSSFIPALMSHLQAKGWKSIYTQVVADEPTDGNAPSLISASRYIKTLLDPDIKTQCTNKTDLVIDQGAVDILIPPLQLFEWSLPKYLDQINKGKEVWFYTYVGPEYEFANRFIELPLLKVRYMHWLNYRYGATGYLHWGFNFWGLSKDKDPFSETTPGNGGGGDCWITYPYKGKFISSIRVDAMRDGIADYELLKMYEAKSKTNADALCKKQIRSLLDYDMDIKTFRATRKTMLIELSK